MLSQQVVIKGAYGSGNFGDDALMFVSSKILSEFYNEENMVFICNRILPYVERDYPGSTIKIKVNRSLNADLLVYGGGTQFFSFPLTSNRTVSFANKLLQNIFSPLLFIKKINNRLRYKPVDQVSSKKIALGLGLGPFVKGSLQEKHAFSLFKKLDYISVRDQASKDICDSWGLSHAVIRSDLCFLTKYFPEISIAAEKNNFDRRKIGVIVRDWPHSKEGAIYLDKIISIANKLRNDGYEVSFISFHESGDKNIMALLRANNEQVLCWDTEKKTIENFMKELRCYDVFVTARYHGAVFGALLGKPVLCIGVENKLKLVSELFCRGARYWGGEFDESSAIELINDLFLNYQEAKEDLHKYVDQQNELGMKMVDEIKNFKLNEKLN